MFIKISFDTEFNIAYLKPDEYNIGPCCWKYTHFDYNSIYWLKENQFTYSKCYFICG